jgi:hypothetical protein
MLPNSDPKKSKGKTHPLLRSPISQTMAAIILLLHKKILGKYRNKIAPKMVKKLLQQHQVPWASY